MNSRPSQIFGIYLIVMSILIAIFKAWCANPLTDGGICQFNFSSSADSLLFIHKTNLLSLFLGLATALFPEAFQSKFEYTPRIIGHLTLVIMALGFTLLSLG